MKNEGFKRFKPQTIWDIHGYTPLKMKETVGIPMVGPLLSGLAFKVQV